MRFTFLTAPRMVAISLLLLAGCGGVATGGGAAEEQVSPGPGPNPTPSPDPVPCGCAIAALATEGAQSFQLAYRANSADAGPSRCKDAELFDVDLVALEVVATRCDVVGAGASPGGAEVYALQKGQARKFTRDALDEALRGLRQQGRPYVCAVDDGNDNTLTVDASRTFHDYEYRNCATELNASYVTSEGLGHLYTTLVALSK